MKYEVNLVKLPAKVLRTISKEVKLPLNAEDEELAQKMIWHIDNSQEEGSEFQAGVGVAAIQYGIPKRMFYINTYQVANGWSEDDANREIEAFRDVIINPKIIATSDFGIALEDGEGCLSVGPNIHNQEGFIYRKNRIVFEGYSYFEKKVKRYDLSGYLAVVAQHELDHLEGKLFVDHIQKSDPWKTKKNARLINYGEK